MADAAQHDQAKQKPVALTELLPKNGLVYSEKANLSEVRATTGRFVCDTFSFRCCIRRDVLCACSRKMCFRTFNKSIRVNLTFQTFSERTGTCQYDMIIKISMYRAVVKGDQKLFGG